MSERNHFNVRGVRVCSVLSAETYSTVALITLSQCAFFEYLLLCIRLVSESSISNLSIRATIEFSLFPCLPPPCSSCSIISKHKALEGLSQGSVEYQALQLVSSLEHYGVEWHWTRDANGQRMAIGVGPEGIAVCKEDFSLVNRYNPAKCTLRSVYV